MPSLNLLKLPIVVSLHGKPSPSSLWLRRPITTAGNPSSSAAAPPPSSPPRFGLRSSWWRITTAKSLHNHTPAGFRFGFLGFRGRRSFNRNSVNCSSFSEDKGGGVVDSSMGSENVNEGQWIGGNGNGNDRSFSSTFSTSNNNKNNHRRQPPPLPEKKHHSDKLLTLPTILTIGRVAAVPLLVGTFYMNSWCGTTATTSIFIAAAITDWLDGYLARRMKLGSAFGAFLDPVADKLMVAATLVLLCTKPPEVALFEQMPWLLTIPSIAIIGREITMSAVREWAASQNGKLSEAVAVNNLGKWKAATQMASLTILLATRDSSFTEASSLITSGVALLYISAGLALWSLVVYMKKIWKVLLR